MILVYQLDQDGLNIVGGINDFISYQYTVCYNDAGSFNLLLPYDQKTFELVSRSDNSDRLVQIDDGFIGIIYKVTLKKEKTVKRISIQGKHINNILAHYSFFRSTNSIINGNICSDMQQLFARAREIYTSPLTPLAIPQWLVVSDQTEYTDSEWNALALSSYSFDYETFDWLKYIKDLSTAVDVGFEVHLKIDYSAMIEHLLLSTKFLVPTTREEVIFHSQISDMVESTYNINSQNFYNVCWVRLDNLPVEFGGRVEVPVMNGVSKAYQIKSYILVVDASNLSFTSMGVIKAYAAGLGRSFLSKHRMVSSYTSNMDLSNSPYELGKDYFLGDKMRLIDTELNLSVDIQLTAYTVSVSNNGVKRITPTFGYSQPMLYEVLKQNGLVL